MGGSWGLLGEPPEGDLDPLRLSGRVLGASWGDLEASWGALGASWNGLVLVCCRSLIFIDFCRGFGVDLGGQKGPKMEPKRSPKRSKIEAKIQHEKRSLLGPSWTGLGPVLGRFRTHLGLENRENSLVFKAFRENSHF